MIMEDMVRTAVYFFPVTAPVTVSYTHLDVYKRQINDKLFHWQSQSQDRQASAKIQRYINHKNTGDIISLLDVYKRQDRDDGLEHEALFVALSPHELYERKVTMQELHAAIASLPNKQAKRIYAHFILGMTKQDIARAEGCLLYTSRCV